MNDQKQALFRTSDGKVKPHLSEFEGASYRDSPLDFLILLARYKFPARLLKKTDSCLDIGCGDGVGTIFLSRFCSGVVGADVDPALVEFNQREYASEASVSFKTMSLLNPDVSQQYDAVVSMDVIEHFPHSETDRVAQSYSRLTKPGGFAMIGTPNRASAPWASTRRKESHLHEFAPDEFESLLSKHFSRVFLFSMTDEIVSTGFRPLAWYLMALCVK